MKKILNINGAKLKQELKDSPYTIAEIEDKVHLTRQGLEKAYRNWKIFDINLTSLVMLLNNPRTKGWFVCKRIKRLSIKDFIVD